MTPNADDVQLDIVDAAKLLGVPVHCVERLERECPTFPARLRLPHGTGGWRLSSLLGWAALREEVGDGVA
ncbi:hypothetical protein DFQ59_107186 [Thioalbus denitrificans]|uniref:AlpA family transcriptional regulator n=1 Tax=Thioalbus denitrificans TaxID=547122 RepID=A0A369C5S8_9GAMM|nr:hypothetical protein DFQ59_107186 [Thioalbus denitrificans]